MTLAEFCNRFSVAYLWIAGQGCPAGREFHQCTSEDAPDEDWCDLQELELLRSLGPLEGRIESGRWVWNGHGNPTDEFGNAIHSIVAGWTS